MLTHRIDTHHHFLPPLYMKYVGEQAVARELVSGRAPSWTPGASVEAMDRNGIQTAVVSISAPGFRCGDATKSIELCRYCNEYAARMVLDYPGRFGSFASLPLPDVDISLKELAYSLDELKADGIGLLTNYDGIYLGDERLTPVFEELNRRKAVVFVHPIETPGACLCGLPPASLEYPFDTTRTIANLLFSGTFTRFRDVRFIFSHAGGAIVGLAERLARLENQPAYRDKIPEGVMTELRRLYFDTALSANDMSLSGLLRFTSADRVLFGSDYPHAPETTMAASVRALAAFGLDPESLMKIENGNAQRLLSRATAGEAERSTVVYI